MKALPRFARPILARLMYVHKILRINRIINVCDEILLVRRTCLLPISNKRFGRHTHTKKRGGEAYLFSGVNGGVYVAARSTILDELQRKMIRYLLL